MWKSLFAQDDDELIKIECFRLNFSALSDGDHIIRIETVVPIAQQEFECYSTESVEDKDEDEEYLALRWRRFNEIEEGFVIPQLSFTTSCVSLSTQSTIPYLVGKHCYSSVSL